MSNDADPPEPDPSAETSTDETAPDRRPPTHEESRRRRPLRRHRDEDDESFAQRLAHQWAQLRDERRGAEPAPIAAGPVATSAGPRCRGASTSPPPGPGGSWSSRRPGYVVLWLLGFFAVITLPLVIALLITALVIPLVRRAAPGRAAARPRRARWSCSAGSPLVGAAAHLRRPAGRHRRHRPRRPGGRGPRRDQGLAARTARCNASDSQINDYIEQRPGRDHRAVQGRRGAQPGHRGRHRGRPRLRRASSSCCSRRTSSSPTASGSGPGWCGSPRAPRASGVDSSGRVAWISLTQFVRATVIVALVDAIGIMIGAAILGVPFVLAIGVLVFLGAFVPLVGATVAGIRRGAGRAGRPGAGHRAADAGRA